MGFILTCACSGPQLEFADWIIEVPAGIPVLEYAPVPMAERDPNAILLTEEIVIGGNLSDTDAAVLQPTRIVGTDNGTIFVADFAMDRVQMYDATGRHVRTLGRAGQGPGEFEWIWGMTIAGDRLVVDDRANARLSTWSLDGEHIDDHPKATRNVLFDMQGLTDGRFVARTTVADTEGSVAVIAVYDPDGTEVTRLSELRLPPPLTEFVVDARRHCAGVCRADSDA